MLTIEAFGKSGELGNSRWCGATWVISEICYWHN